MTRMIGVMSSSEVDPTGSLWYISVYISKINEQVLKLTLPGHYGILSYHAKKSEARSEVDPTGSLWYIALVIVELLGVSSEVDPTGSLWYTRRATGT